jgi:hypothetical protein
VAEAAERDRQKVKQIIVGTGSGSAGLNITSGGDSKDNASSLVEENRDLVFINVGERVMAWKAGPVPKYGSGGVRARNTHGVLDADRKKRLMLNICVCLFLPSAALFVVITG